MFSESDRADVEAAIALVGAAGLGPLRVARLLTAFGSPRASLEAGADAWSALLGMRRSRAAAALADALGRSSREEFDAHAALGARPVLLGSRGYPPLLAAIPDPPPILWLRGELREEDLFAVAVVGARRATPYGLDQAARFATVLAENGYPVVSGGARGIDAAAHRAVLRAKGRTIAVLGSGLATPYPPEHRPLFDAIVEGGGAVVSELPCRAAPLREHFPRRNRILSGLSLGVLLIEAWARSGASITARLAVECHDRDAFALPGRVDSPASEGCLRAIREGWAGLVASPEDLLRGLGHAGSLACGAAESARRERLDPDARRIGERLLRLGEAQADEIDPEEPIGRTLALLTCLEVQGLARRSVDGRFASTERLGRLLSG